MHNSSGKENWASLGRAIWMSLSLVKVCATCRLGAWSEGLVGHTLSWSSWARVWGREQGVQASQPSFWRALNLMRVNGGFLFTERLGNLDNEWWEIMTVCSQSWQTWWLRCEMREYMALGKKKLKEIKKKSSSGWSCYFISRVCKGKMFSGFHFFLF